DERLEDARRRAHREESPELRADALESVGRAARHEEHVPRAELSRLAVGEELVAPLADDEGLVEARVPMEARPRVRRLARLDDGVGAVAIRLAPLEREGDPAEGIGRAFHR